MKATFPHMGNTYITAKAMLDDLGVDYVIPPRNNKKTLEIGTKYAPEMACLPFKINIGNYLQAYEQGADTIIITGGCGPCRFGYYCEMHREILKDLGCNMDIITLEWPDKGFPEFVRRIKKLTGGFNPLKLAKVIKNTTQVALLTDELERLTFKTRPREIEKGSTDRIYKSFHEKVMNAAGSREIKQVINSTRDELLNVAVDEGLRPLRVGIVGEIYTTIDSHTNFEIEAMLGNMGIEVYRPVTVSGWIVDHMLKKALSLPRDMSFAEAARPYLGKMIGGHALETIGNTVLYARQGFDGVIQIYPFTCMPEIVAESILPAIEHDYGIPILTLIIDEMTGEAGYKTRVEAFADLLKRRRERASLGEDGALSWS